MTQEKRADAKVDGLFMIQPKKRDSSLFLKHPKKIDKYFVHLVSEWRAQNLWNFIFFMNNFLDLQTISCMCLYLLSAYVCASNKQTFACDPKCCGLVSFLASLVVSHPYCIYFIMHKYNMKKKIVQ